MLLISEIEALFISKTRTKRSPDSESIQRWKLAFSGDLSTPFASSTKLPSILTCNWALYELCLKHVSCRELWVLFRRNCVVDAQNNCRMSNKNDCWQSYEGISWTGLGACTCPGNNSDCHWIRLQTTYNKCIFELNNDASWHVQLNSLAQYSANRRGSGLAPISTSNPLTSMRVPITPSHEKVETKIENESENKRRQMIANEARLARIHAQEQRKLQLKEEQESEKRRRDKLEKESEGVNTDNHGNIQNYEKNIQELRQKPTPTTQKLNQEATIKFKNVVLKDEKPRKNQAKTRLINSNGINGKEKLDTENNFNEQNGQQNKVSEQNNHQQNKHQNMFEKLNEHKNISEKLNESELQNKLDKNMFVEEKNKPEQKQIYQKIKETPKTNKTSIIKTFTPPTLYSNNKNRNNSVIEPSPKPLQIFPTQTNEHLVTQAEIPPTTKITEFLKEIDQNKKENQSMEENPVVGSNVTLGFIFTKKVAKSLETHLTYLH
uniref:GDNF/GAS1 domain-containing protein n=1 Tax=Meloidogyne incognita TaxID=6306 RepID=A0A914KKW8_MELIC